MKLIASSKKDDFRVCLFREILKMIENLEEKN